MNFSQWVTTSIEFLVVAVVICAVLYEPAIAKWEEKQKEKVLKALKERKGYRK